MGSKLTIIAILTCVYGLSGMLTYTLGYFLFDSSTGGLVAASIVQLYLALTTRVNTKDGELDIEIGIPKR